MGHKLLPEMAFSGIIYPAMVLKILGLFKNILFLWILTFVVNIITFLFIYYKIEPSGRTLALHYNVLVGVDWYGKGYNLYLIPGIAFAISIANLVLYRSLRDSGNFLSFLTVFVSLSVQIILLVAILFLSTVN
jgi:hypothetical protein